LVTPPSEITGWPGAFMETPFVMRRLDLTSRAVVLVDS